MIAVLLSWLAIGLVGIVASICEEVFDPSETQRTTIETLYAVGLLLMTGPLLYPFMDYRLHHERRVHCRRTGRPDRRSSPKERRVLGD